MKRFDIQRKTNKSWIWYVFLGGGESLEKDKNSSINLHDATQELTTFQNDVRRNLIFFSLCC